MSKVFTFVLYDVDILDNQKLFTIVVSFDVVSSKVISFMFEQVLRLRIGSRNFDC